MIRQLLAFSLFVIASFSNLFGHKIDAMEFDFKATEKQWALEGIIDLTYMLPEFRTLDSDDGPLSRYDLMEASPEAWAEYFAKIEFTARELLSFKFADKDVPFTVTFPDFDTTPFALPEDPEDVALITVRLNVEPVDGPGELRVRWMDPMEAELIINNPESEAGILSAIPGESLPLLKRDASGVTEAPQESAIWNWLKFGFHHVVPKGLDHLLFILGLFLAAPRLRPILGQSLLFTLAHSITLTCAVMGWINFPTTYIEILIAASIAWIGIENLWLKKIGRSRIALVFTFGLIHGLGFASVLGDLLEQVPKDKQLMPLIGFNIGVEIAQVTVLIIAWLLIRPFKTHQARIQFVGSILIAAAGIFWMVERIGSLS